MYTAHIPIAFRLTGKAVLAERGNHPMSANWVPSRWDCRDSGPLTPPEAADVLTSHGPGHDCDTDCRIGRTARKVRARLIDAPTVRTSAFRRILHTR